MNLAAAIEHLSNQQIAYCNFEPANLLLCADGYLKLNDFDNAKPAPEDTIKDTDVNLNKSIFAYMAPERLRGQAYGLPVDMWSIGVFAYELITGHHPYQTY